MGIVSKLESFLYECMDRAVYYLTMEPARPIFVKLQLSGHFNMLLDIYRKFANRFVALSPQLKSAASLDKCKREQNRQTL